MKKKRIIIGIIICLFIILVGLIVVRQMYYNKQEVSIDGRTAKDQILLNGFGVFSEKYTGPFKTTEIISKIQENVKVDIPKLYDDIKKADDSKLEEYYSQNSGDLKTTFGFSNVDDFKKVAKYLQNLSFTPNNWYSLNLNRESFVDESDKPKYAYAEYTLKYENNEKINFSIYISHNKSTLPNYIINIIDK